MNENHNSGSISQVKEDVEKLINLKIDRFKLQSTDALARLFNRLMVIMLIMTLIAILVGLLAIGISIWIGELLGSYALGVLIAAVTVIVVIVFLYIKRDKLFLNSMTRFFIKLIFPDNDAKE